MKKAVLTGLLAVCTLLAQAQETPKTGWVFTPMPNISYNSDVGLNLGAFSDFFYYGDGTIYPNFLHHAGFSAAFATKGSWYIHGYFESVALIPGLRINATATYRDARANEFYGYNGIASPFYGEYHLNKETRTAWYTNRRRFFRASASIQGKLDPPMKWLAGLVFRHVAISDFDLKNYDSGKSLYLEYIRRDLIHADEAGGGNSLELKAVLSDDTRDIELAPQKGIFAEGYLVGNADLDHWKYNYAQIVLHWRHYVTLFPERLIFAYHLGLQHTFAGELPFYNINELATLFYTYEENSGLGSRYSVRGFRYNRIAAAGYAWANVELRVTPFKFNLFKQHFDIVLNPFLDLASITKTYRLDRQKILIMDDAMNIYQERKLPVMASAGIGAKLHMNTNFILSVDFAKAFDPQLSEFTVGMATTYVF